MTNEQKAALERIDEAKRHTKAASDIYMSAPSGLLGGIARECRKNFLDAHVKEQEAIQKALHAGCDLADVYGYEYMRGMTLEDVREELEAIGHA